MKQTDEAKKKETRNWFNYHVKKEKRKKEKFID